MGIRLTIEFLDQHGEVTEKRGALMVDETGVPSEEFGRVVVNAINRHRGYDYPAFALQ